MAKEGKTKRGFALNPDPFQRLQHLSHYPAFLEILMLRFGVHEACKQRSLQSPSPLISWCMMVFSPTKLEERALLWRRVVRTPGAYSVDNHAYTKIT